MHPNKSGTLSEISRIDILNMGFEAVLYFAFEENRSHRNRGGAGRVKWYWNDSFLSLFFSLLLSSFFLLIFLLFFPHWPGPLGTDPTWAMH